MSEQKDSVYDKWRDAYLMELDIWSANETPMRESLFGAGMRHADKRIAELEGMIVRLHNTHPQNIAGILKWWTDMFALMPRSAFSKSEGGADD